MFRRCSAPATIVRGGQRFGGDQRRLQRVDGRRAGLQDLVGERHRFFERPAPEREPRAEHADRPLVPAARLPPVGAVRVAGARQKLAGRFVAAAYEVNLRQRVEHGAGRLVKLNRAADLERPVERLFGARQIAEAHANLPERAERDRESVARAVLLVQRHAALGERERLLVPVLQHHDARLIAADGGEHVVGMHDRRKPLGLTERGHRFVVASELGERDARQRMDERQMATISRGVESGRGFGDVLAHGRGVADVPVALAELVVREPDAPGLVGELGLLEGAAVQRNRARLVAADVGQPPVQPPERREAARRHGFAEGIGRPAERRRGLLQIVLQQPGLRQHRPQSQLFVARQRGRSKDRGHDLRGLGATAAIERGAGTREHGLRQRRRHAASIRQTRRAQAAPNRRASAVSVSWNAASCVSTRSSAAIAWASLLVRYRHGERRWPERIVDGHLVSAEPQLEIVAERRDQHVIVQMRILVDRDRRVQKDPVLAASTRV